MWCLEILSSDRMGQIYHRSFLTASITCIFINHLLSSALAKGISQYIPKPEVGTLLVLGQGACAKEEGKWKGEGGSETILSPEPVW